MAGRGGAGKALGAWGRAQAGGCGGQGLLRCSGAEQRAELCAGGGGERQADRRGTALLVLAGAACTTVACLRTMEKTRFREGGSFFRRSLDALLEFAVVLCGWLFVPVS